ncbi:MAG: nuclear transport factor 2 family protein [Terriglobales bacterium]
MSSRKWLGNVTLALLCALGAAPSQGPPEDKIPIERCDLLPVVLVRIDGTDMRFLLDTAATTTLNIKSFAQGRSKKIQISSWSGTAATSAREVLLPQLSLGSHRLENLRLPAIDLSPIGQACGGQIDGILGIDLLDKMGTTIDLKRRVAQLGGSAADEGEKHRLAEHEAAMNHCLDAFNAGRADELKDCFDPEIVLYTPWGEFRGREQVMKYLNQRFLHLEPHPRMEITTHDKRLVGDAVWHGYDYKIESTELHIAGRGMMICRKNGGRWQLLNMHNSFIQPDPQGRP